jgi:hypothetical protein
MDNKGCEVSLELRKLYRLVPDEKSAQRGCVRIIDESGEDYIYPAQMFRKIPIEEPLEAQLQALAA